ncbi:hypothetical protein GSI_15395 [Ganoderma sinense ZZ0214-1]|uniref:Uncharacterized protein n=1 Tax=Ganoderma sinense ZZ0214-1 TaxID=1077348 RepID=A0A2G8RMG7_9APHY|nr:hypothetical protein GSI_15395 [Ganoderma sinense ZZ0214-1]
MPTAVTCVVMDSPRQDGEGFAECRRPQCPSPIAPPQFDAVTLIHSYAIAWQ